MWKYASRRCRDTFERSANHFDKRSTTNVVNCPGNVNDEKPKWTGPPCRWFCPRKSWKNCDDGNDTNSKRWNFDHLNRTWIGAITWSSALVLGWYTSHLVHLKLKRKLKDEKRFPAFNSILLSIQPYISCGNKEALCLNTKLPIDKIINTFAPTVHLVANEHSGVDRNATPSPSSNDSSPNSNASDNDFGDVLNTIENQLGLAAIEKGQHQDGLNLLRSAANRQHPPALYNLGLCYETGLGVSVDEKMAMELYRSAAILEHPGALYNLGIYYGQGRGGLKQDQETGLRLLRLAAVQGHQNAISALKELDVKEPPHKVVDTWAYSHSPFFQNDMVPTQTRLFVENVNFLPSNKCENTAMYVGIPPLF